MKIPCDWTWQGMCAGNKKFSVFKFIYPRSCLESMRSVRQKVSGDSAELGIKIDAMENERFKLKAMKTRLDNDLNDVDAQSQVGTITTS